MKIFKRYPRYNTNGEKTKQSLKRACCSNSALMLGYLEFLRVFLLYSQESRSELIFTIRIHRRDLEKLLQSPIVRSSLTSEHSDHPPQIYMVGLHVQDALDRPAMPSQSFLNARFDIWDPAPPCRAMRCPLCFRWTNIIDHKSGR
jgi:hypothetical protein